MEHMRENRQHKTAAAIAPGAVMLGFAGSTQLAGLFIIGAESSGQEEAYHRPQPENQFAI